MRPLVAKVVAYVPPARISDRREDFLARVDRSGGEDACWGWLGTRRKDGTPIFSNFGVYHRAHRFAYELFVGPVDGIFVSRVCRNEDCTNQKHFEARTEPGSLPVKLHPGHIADIQQAARDSEPVSKIARDYDISERSVRRAIAAPPSVGVSVSVYEKQLARSRAALGLPPR